MALIALNSVAAARVARKARVPHVTRLPLVAIHTLGFFSNFFMTSSQENGGHPGAIRESVGAFSQRAWAQEEQYFRKQEVEKLKDLPDVITEHYNYPHHVVNKKKDAKGSSEKNDGDKKNDSDS